MVGTPDSSTRKKQSANAQAQPRQSGKFATKPVMAAKAPAPAPIKKAVAKPVAKPVAKATAMPKLHPYEFKSIKKTRGSEGEGFTATLYFEGKPIADVADYGDGGSLRIHYASHQVREEQEAALAVWHRTNCQGDYSRALDSDDESALNLLYNLQSRNKDSAKKIIFEIGPDISLMSDAEAKKFFQSGASFTQSEQLELKNSTLDNIGDLQFIHKKYPDARVWDASTQSYRPITDFLKA